jgi:hypothetical protein
MCTACSAENISAAKCKYFEAVCCCVLLLPAAAAAGFTTNGATGRTSVSGCCEWHQLQREALNSSVTQQCAAAQQEQGQRQSKAAACS